MVTTYLGLTWWDNETDGDKMYPADERRLSSRRARRDREAQSRRQRAARAVVGSRRSCSGTGIAGVQRQLKQTQFADFHGHGWMFRAVFKRDRKGNCSTRTGKPVTDASATALGEAVGYHRSARRRPSVRRQSPSAPPSARGKPVHLKDIHLERGMQCVDCHFKQDNHGNGKLYSEPRAPSRSVRRLPRHHAPSRVRRRLPRLDADARRVRARLQAAAPTCAT